MTARFLTPPRKCSRPRLHEPQIGSSFARATLLHAPLITTLLTNGPALVGGLMPEMCGGMLAAVDDGDRRRARPVQPPARRDRQPHRLTRVTARMHQRTAVMSAGVRLGTTSAPWRPRARSRSSRTLVGGVRRLGQGWVVIVPGWPGLRLERSLPMSQVSIVALDAAVVDAPRQRCRGILPAAVLVPRTTRARS